MTEYSIDDFPEQLIQAIESNRIIPVVGAGVSKGIKDKNGQSLYPDWIQLLKHSTQYLKNQKADDVADTVNLFIDLFNRRKDSNYLLDAAHEAQVGLKDSWIGFLTNFFDKDESECDLESLEVTKLIWKIAENIVITTNFDESLEWGLEKNNGKKCRTWIIEPPEGLDSRDFRENKHSKKTLWYWHGSIQYPNGIVLSKNKYDEVYSIDKTENPHPFRKQFFNEFLPSYSLLFIGFSFNDAYFEEMITSSLGATQNTHACHYIIIHKSEKESIDKIIKNNPKYNLRALVINEFSEIPKILSCLEHIKTTTVNNVNNSERCCKVDDNTKPIVSGNDLEIELPKLIHDPNKKHLSDLYISSVPSGDYSDEFNKFLSKNHNLNKLELYSLGKKALDNKEDLFANSEEPKTFHSKNVIISGPTGCGKTALMESLILNSILERNGSCIYISPTRELVYEFHNKVSKTIKKLEICSVKSSQIVKSTGEFSSDDYKINNNLFKAAFIVNEKINILLDLAAKSVLDKVSLVIIDELHMISDPQRGGVVDSLIAKFMEEDERRKNKGSTRSIQIIGITTEFSSPILKKALTKRETINLPSMLPIQINVEERPISVLHQVAVLNDSKHADYKLNTIIDFKSQNDRKLELKDNKEQAERSKKSIARGSGKWIDAFDTGVNPNRARSSLIQLCYDMFQEYGVTVVAMPSVSMLETLSNSMISQHLSLQSNKNAYEEEVNELSPILDRLGLPKSQYNRILKSARHGVFYHYAALPIEVKSWVVKLFSKKRTQNEKNIILFTTETLTYGVNLSADCVILASTEWPRKSIYEASDADEVQQERLDQNTYHNILGRAGRPGKFSGQKKPTAIICVKASEFSSVPERKDFLKSFYHSEELESISTYIDRKSALYKLEKNSVNIYDFPYPTFRTIMDALRHVGRTGGNAGATSTQIENFMRRTVFACQELRNVKLQDVVELFLESASKHNLTENKVKVVYKTDDNYVISPQGEALIDTGTQLQSIEPISDWLSLLKENKDKLSDLDIPIELQLPGLIVTPDFWSIGKELTEEASKSKTMDSGVIEEREKSANDQLMKELEFLNLNRNQIDVFFTIFDIFSSKWASRAPLKSKNPELKKVVLIKLTTICMMWLRGKDTYHLKELFPDGGAAKREFQPKHAERLGWLSIMTSRFFRADKKGEGFLLEEHERDIHQHIIKIRYGLPFKGLPLLGKNPISSKISRHQASKILKSNADTLTYSIWPFEDNNNKYDLRYENINKSHVEDNIKSFFENEIDNLLNNIFPISDIKVSTLLDSIINILKSMIDSDIQIFNKIKTRKSKELLKIIYDLSYECNNKFDESECRDTVRISPPNRDGCLMFEDKEAILFVLDSSISNSCYKSLNSKQKVIRVCSFAPKEENSQLSSRYCASITLFGLIGLTSLLSRGFLSVEELYKGVSTIGSPSNEITSVKWFASNIETSSANKTPALESILSFYEPGITR
ncbi:SIR2 family protein [Photobacterium alginatilyticum]|uniref:SIR2 family protein n=1 Tax=Photobacterium alginatilyticum TaxID=1775171 RepID=UPI004068A6A2